MYNFQSPKGALYVFENFDWKFIFDTKIAEHLKHVKAWLVPWLDPPTKSKPLPFRNTIRFCSRKTKIQHQ